MVLRCNVYIESSQKRLSFFHFLSELILCTMNQFSWPPSLGQTFCALCAELLLYFVHVDVPNLGVRMMIPRTAPLGTAIRMVCDMCTCLFCAMLRL